MEKEFYYSKEGKQVGPISIEKLALEQINPETLVWCKGMEGWKPAGQVPMLANIITKSSSLPNETINSIFGNNLNPADKPKNYLVLAILVTLFCCWPIGIPAIVFAARVDKKFALGDLEGAKTASDNSKLFSFLSIGLGLLVVIFYLFIAFTTQDFPSTY